MARVRDQGGYLASHVKYDWIGIGMSTTRLQCNNCYRGIVHRSFLSMYCAMWDSLCLWCRLAGVVFGILAGEYWVARYGLQLQLTLYCLGRSNKNLASWITGLRTTYENTSQKYSLSEIQRSTVGSRHRYLLFQECQIGGK